MNTLNAKDGMYLTQVGEAEGRVFATSITGVSATYEYWRDATAEEKEEYEKKQALEAEAQKAIDEQKEIV